MAEPRNTAVAVRVDPIRAWSSELLQTTGGALARAGSLAVDTAQRFASVVSALMGPAVFSAYCLAAWSLAANMGWTGSFLYKDGPLSNWLIWLGIAILVHIAADVLRRRTRQD
jgi:hypothetical protein